MNKMNGLFVLFNDNKAKVSIVLSPQSQKSFFLGGETIEGEVYLDVVADNFRGDRLCLVFQGGERTCTCWKTGDGKNRKRHTKYQSRELVKISMDLAIFNKSEDMPVQKKIFPLRFTLPDPLPPTITRMKGAEGGWAELTYAINASLVTPGYVWNGEISCQQNIYVSGASKNVVLVDPGI